VKWRSGRSERVLQSAMDLTLLIHSVFYQYSLLIKDVVRWQCEKPVKWRSGRSERVLQSAMDFAAGFQEDLDFLVFPERPDAYKDGESPDDYFRSWSINKAFVAARGEMVRFEIRMRVWFSMVFLV
jgi:hypothetical protein